MPARPYRVVRPVIPLIWVNSPFALIVLLQDIIVQKRDKGTDQLQQENLMMRTTSDFWQVETLDIGGGGYSVLTGASSRRPPIVAYGRMTQQLRSWTSSLRSSGGLRTADAPAASSFPITIPLPIFMNSLHYRIFPR
jgi:hypothetical protein